MTHTHLTDEEKKEFDEMYQRHDGCPPYGAIERMMSTIKAKAVEERNREIVELAEKIIKDERYSGAPHVLNKLITALKQ